VNIIALSLVVAHVHVSLIIAMTTSHIMNVIRRTIETAPAKGGGGGLMLTTSSAGSTVIVAVTILRTHVVVV